MVRCASLKAATSTQIGIWEKIKVASYEETTVGWKLTVLGNCDNATVHGCYVKCRAPPGG